MAAIVGTALALLAPAVADAATRYAAPGGTGPAATCPEADPCSLADAVEDPSVAASDEVIVAPGTYNESNTLLIDDDIYVHGAQGAPFDVSIVTSNSQGVWVDSPGATLSDLSITHTAGVGDGLLLLRGYAERVSSYSSGAFACTLGGSAPNEALIRDSVCFASGSGVAAAVRVSGTSSTYGTLINVTAQASGSGYGVTAFGTGGGTIQLTMKNTIARTSASPSYDVVADEGDGTTTVEVVASNSNYDTERELSAGGVASVTDPGSGTNQTAAPMLAPFQTVPQLPGSPTIDAGASDPLLGQFDLSGQLRTEGAAPDIGADEADGMPPTVTIDSGPSGATTDATPTFSFSSNEPGPFECRLDVGAFGACSGPGNTHTTTPLGDGTYTFEVRGSDGYNFAVAARTFRVDTTAPETDIVRGPRPRTRKKRAKFRFEADEPGATFECKLDRGAYRSCTSPVRFRNVARGRHRFFVKAIDAVGNEDSTPSRYRWRRTRG